jgi:hypothetical protein
MEPTTPPPEPTAVTPQQLQSSSTQFTPRPGDDPRWAAPPAPHVNSSSALPVMVVATVCLAGTCMLGAMLGSWILVMIGLIVGLLVFHYFVWGWLYTRMIAAQQKEELLRLAEEDAALLPDPQRSRHI